MLRFHIKNSNVFRDGLRSVTYRLVSLRVARISTMNRKYQTGSISLSSTLALSFIALVAMIFLLAPCIAHSFKLKLAWDPNPPEEEVVGYRLYYGTERCDDSLSCVYPSRSSLIKANRCSDGVCEYTYSRLAKGLTYYLSLVAQNAYGLESDFSGQVSVNTCEYKLGPKKKKFRAEGGSNHFTVKTQPDCDWTVPSAPSWIQFTSQTTGQGTTDVNFTVSPNTGPEPRAAVFSIKSKVFTITQAGQ